jgi:hypothetical protein
MSKAPVTRKAALYTHSTQSSKSGKSALSSTVDVTGYSDAANASSTASNPLAAKAVELQQRRAAEEARWHEEDAAHEAEVRQALDDVRAPLAAAAASLDNVSGECMRLLEELGVSVEEPEDDAQR